jgi:NADH:ubiquinone oxidoreductase subunit C
LTGRTESRKTRKEEPSDKVEHTLAAALNRIHPIEKKLVSSSKGLIRIKSEEIRETASIIKSNLDGVIGETVVGVDLQNKQFELIYFFWSLMNKVMIDIRTRVEGDNPAIDSICDIFPGLDWHEREIHEMFGVKFNGHPNMNLLILPDELEGAYPLRKSFQVSRERVKESGIFTPIAKAAKPTKVSTDTNAADEGG